MLFTSPRESHIIMYAQILLSALPAARLAGFTREYLRIVVENVRQYLSPEGSERTMELLRILRHAHKVLVYWHGLLLKADGPNSFVVPSFYVFMCQCGGVSFDKIFGCVFSLTEVFSGLFYFLLKHIAFYFSMTKLTVFTVLLLLCKFVKFVCISVPS